MSCSGVPCLVVVGTGTGVGKTEVAALLVLALGARGVDVAASKPLASGCRRVRGRLVSDDALRLVRALGIEGTQRWEAHDAMSPWRAQRPVAPALALARAPSTRELVRHVEGRARGRGALVLEAAGGLLVPYTRDGTVLDVLLALSRCRTLATSVVLVGASALGTINHTCLSIGALREVGLAPAAVVLSRTHRTRTPDERGNAAAIARIARTEAPMVVPLLVSQASRARARRIALAVTRRCLAAR